MWRGDYRKRRGGHRKRECEGDIDDGRVWKKVGVVGNGRMGKRRRGWTSEEVGKRGLRREEYGWWGEGGG